MKKACNGGIQLGCDELKVKYANIRRYSNCSKEERMKSLNI